MQSEPRTDRARLDEFMTKNRSKREVYLFMEMDLDHYLPPIKTITGDWLIEVWKERVPVSPLKLFTDFVQTIKRSRMSLARVPHYEGLQIKDLLDFATKTGIRSYVPIVGQNA